MGVIGASLGVLSVGALALTMTLAKKHPNAIGLAFAQVMVWSYTMIAQRLLHHPASDALNPVIDVLLASYVAWRWWKDREGYVLVFLGLLVLQGWWHVDYFSRDAGRENVYNYLAGLNLTFVAQTLCAAWPGLTDVASRIGDYMRGHSLGHLHVGRSQ